MNIKSVPPPPKCIEEYFEGKDKDPESSFLYLILAVVFVALAVYKAWTDYRKEISK